MKKTLITLVAVLAITAAAQATVTIDFVTVGDAGNTTTMTVDPGHFAFTAREAGAVDHDFYISKYETTAGQYAEFLNAKSGVVGTYSLYNTQMYPQADGCQIEDNGDGTYTAHQPDLPVNYITIGSAMRFVNWLDNGQGAGDTESGVYDIAGEGSVKLALVAGRDAGAFFFLPNLDEWCKAAYYNAGADDYWNFATQSDIIPTAEVPPGTDAVNGSANYNNVANLTDVGDYTFKPSDSPYGTFDQNGNVFEFVEAVQDMGWGQYTIIMGGSFPDTDLDPTAGDTWFSSSNFRGAGFRVAAIPEPATMSLLAIGGIAALIRRRKS